LSSFRFHGVRVRVRTDCQPLREALERDFSFFRDETVGPADVTLDARLGPPPYDAAPDATSGRVSPRCVVYDVGGERFVDYQGRALMRYVAATETGELTSSDFDLLHETSYLFILSRLGELHDRRGLHRLHALGVERGGSGVVCVMPSGTGKTTLGLDVLRMPGTALLSDDTPIVTVSGDLLCFPNRPGLAAPPEDVAADHVRPFHRLEHGTKWLIDVEAFAGRIAASAAPSAVVIGVRRLSGPGRLDPIPRIQAVPELMRSMVVGIGLPQVLEYFLQGGARDAWRKSRIVASRSRAAFALLRRARTYRLLLGRDREENAALLATLLREP
jgi:hypothetical protein